jgi:AmmeMemoRadiSam system protein B
MIRPPAVAGQFYPADAGQVEAELDRVIHPVVEPRHAIAIIVPHAGWMYSGATAGIVYSAVKIPDHVIMIGPNHHNTGKSTYALFDAGKWQTPTGDVPVDEPLGAALLDNCDWFAEAARSHSAEHSLEVQLPMLRRVNPKVRVAPIMIGGSWPESGGRRILREIAEAIVMTVREFGAPVLLLASTDMNHYEDQETAHIKDKLVLGAIEKLNEDAMMDNVRDVEVSMCGVAATYIVMHAAKKLGAKRAEVLDYRTSGDVTGDFASVVGYAGMLIA